MGDCCTIVTGWKLPSLHTRSWISRTGLKLIIFYISLFKRLPPPHSVYRHIVAVKATIDKQSPHSKLLLKLGIFYFETGFACFLFSLSKCYVISLAFIFIFSFVYCFGTCEQDGTLITFSSKNFLSMESNTGKSDVTILQHMCYAIVYVAELSLAL